MHYKLLLYIVYVNLIKYIIKIFFFYKSKIFSPKDLYIYMYICMYIRIFHLLHICNKNMFGQNVLLLCCKLIFN